MMDDRSIEQLRAQAAGYREPPPVPAEAMWARIAGDVESIVAGYAAASAPVGAASGASTTASDATRAAHTPVRTRGLEKGMTFWRGQPLMAMAGLAAVLVLGVGIGRWTAPARDVAASVATIPSTAGTTLPTAPTTSHKAPAVASKPSHHADTGELVAALPITREQLPKPAVHREVSAQSFASAPAPRSDAAERDPVRPAVTKQTVIPTAGLVATTGDRQPAAAQKALDAPKSDGNNSVYALTASRHFTNAETFLTSFRVSAKAGRVDPKMNSWARDLLFTTRVLADAPGTRDPQLQKLLGDLELVLVQLSTYRPGRTSNLGMATRSINQSGILSRLREVTNL